jgi:hypothetical protein
VVANYSYYCGHFGIVQALLSPKTIDRSCGKTNLSLRIGNIRHKKEREIKRVFFVTFIIFLLLAIEGQAQNYSILTGTVAELNWRWLVIETNDSKIVPFRVGRNTVYYNRIPAVGDKVKVEYLIVRGVHIGYSVAIMENVKEEIGFQKNVVESPSQKSSLNPPPKIPGFAGKWEGFWDNKKDYRFTLTIANVSSEIADVKYESKDMQFFEKAEVIPGEKPRIEWMVNSVVKPEGPFASPTTPGTKEYYAILIESIPIYYSFEIQKDGTLKGTFDSKRMSKLGTSRTAVMKRLN